MKKSIIFDTGPLISLATNNLLWILEPLKEKFGGDFYITNSVKRECIERPMSGKKFKFEALQILRLVEEGTLKIYNSKTLNEKTNDMLQLANSLFMAQNNYIKNVQYAEMEVITSALELNSDAVVIDEFVTRMVIEDVHSVRDRMQKRLHMKVSEEKDNLKKFKSKISNINVIRSFELVTISFEKGLFDKYILNISKPKKTLLEGLLWAIKLNGCSVSEQEIKEVMNYEGLLVRD